VVICSTGCSDISGLAVHWEDEIVFWSDVNLGHIMYSQLDGRYHAFLLTGLDKPKSLAVDPVEGYLSTAAVFALSFFSSLSIIE